MHTEGEIRKAVKVLLEAEGELNTTEVKQRLNEVLTFDEQDKQMSTTRNEMLIIQRIGNIVAHQTEVKHNYPEGFCVDKSKRPAIFTATAGIGNNIKPISEADVKKRKKSATKNRQKTYRKVNWEFVNERRSSIGQAGEEFVYHREIEKVKIFSPSDIDKVMHLSEQQGDGFGYDILSLNEKGEAVYIEVKTTIGNVDAPFYMSENERSFFEDNIDNNAYIYRVFNFNQSDSHGDIKIISAKDLFENYNFDPISYAVTPK